MKLNMRRWVGDVIGGRRRLAVPLMTHPGIALSGKKVIDAIKKGENHFAAIKAIHDTYPTAVAVANIMMDLTVEAEAFGSHVRFAEDEVPTVTGRIVHDEESIRALTIPTLGTARIPEYLRATGLAVDHLTDRPVFAGCIGPISLAGRLYDMSELMTALYTEPDSIKQLLRKCSEFLLEYVLEFKKLGANGIIMAEPAAGLLSAEMCDEFSSVFVRDIVGKVQDEQFIFILHNCGNTGHCTASMVSTGAWGLHLGNKIDMAGVLRDIPKDVIAMGNLDPVGVFRMASPQKMHDETMALLEQTAEFRNFIISSGCDTPPGVPKENIDMFFDTVAEFNNRP